MRIELRNIKHFAAGSEETNCFVATIYVDGVKAGEARNEGHGGPTLIHPFDLERRINEYAKTLPKLQFPESFGVTGDASFYAQDAESIVGDLLTDHLIQSDLRKLLAKTLVYTRTDKAGVFTAKRKGETAAQLRVLLADATKVQAFRKQHNVRELLNLLPFDEALNVYKSIASL